MLVLATRKILSNAVSVALMGIKISDVSRFGTLYPPKMSNFGINLGALNAERLGTSNVQVREEVTRYRLTQRFFPI